MRTTTFLGLIAILSACSSPTESTSSGSSESSGSATTDPSATLVTTASDSMTASASMSDSVSASDSATVTSADSSTAATDTASTGDSSGTGESTAADSSGGSSSGGGSSSESTGSGACVDSDGANEDEASATDLGEQACDAALTMASGTIVDMADQDWFALQGAYVDDNTCGNDDPVIAVAVDDPTLTVCVYFSCNVGGTALVDCGGADEVDPGNGELGCCAQGNVDLTMNCTGTGDESATIAIQVTSDVEVDCVDYELSVDYDV